MGMSGYDKARKNFVFRRFHVEGFANTYVQEDSDDAKKIVFETNTYKGPAQL